MAVRTRLAALPRLVRNTLGALLDRNAAVRMAVPVTLGPGGCVEDVEWRKSQVMLRGWCRDSVTLGFAGDALQPITPWLARRDLGPGLDHAGFETVLDRPTPRAALTIRSGAGEIVFLAPTPRAERRARLIALPAALGFAARHWRDILRFLIRRDPGTSVALREAFGLEDALKSGPLMPADLFPPQSTGPAPQVGPTVILVPVFNAPDHVARLLECLARPIGIDHHILLIDDASTDPLIAPMLDAFAAAQSGRASLITLKKNNGFVGAVNHGLDLACDLGRHVILLNTDTLPPPDWAARLIRPILDDPNVASVTPVSNTAEIASIPAQGVETPLTPNFVERIDRAAQALNPKHALVEIPTGIGFAMAMNRRFLDLVGGLDPAFGRGYGEEVDWCQKARASGGRHVLAANLFVGHEGGASFGSLEKRQRVKAAGEIISARYPYFDREVAAWAQTAPHGAARIALALAWMDAVSPDPVPVYLGHVLGGGAEMALKREVAAALAAGAPGVAILRAGGAAPWRIEIEGQGFSHAARLQDRAQTVSLLRLLTRREIVYSCGVGARQPTDIPHMLIDLSEGHSLHLRLHDYYPISASYSLLDADGVFRGVPAPGNRDPAHSGPVPLSDWQDCWSSVIDRATAITTYSAVSADLLAQAYPTAAAKTRVAPHALNDMPATLPPGGRAIGVLGGINQAKGAEVLTALARHMAASADQRTIVVIGELDPNYRLPRPHRVLGRYQRHEIAELAAWHDIGLWLIPSVWPETFSFTTREALATGLPVLTFDLGAQAEAARAAPNGHVVGTPPADTAALMRRIEEVFGTEAPQTVTMSRLAR